MKKNDDIILNITDVTLDGNGVGRHEGMAVFVPATAPGDEIDCHITKVNKSYAFGICRSIRKPSPHRQDRGCAVFGRCGGCSFRHISYEAECRIKEKAVLDDFVRIGGFARGTFEYLPIMGDTRTDRYRNKAQYPIAADESGRAFCGFYAKRSHRVIECEDCLLQPEIFSSIAGRMIQLINERHIPVYDEATGKGCVRHIYLRRGEHSGQIQLTAVAAYDHRGLRKILGIVGEEFGDIGSVVLNINPRRDNVILGDKCITVSKGGTITDIMCGNEITLSPLSFYQVNTLQAERLYAAAKALAAPAGDEELLDLYCGAGTIGLSMAKDVRHLTGVEIVPQAVENARKNADANGITNADFICDDAGGAAKRFSEQGLRPDIIITDPPRKGCDTATLEAITAMSPKRVVMVSCDPATAARDCAYLSEHGYALKAVQAVDLYPGTGHVETVCCLYHQKNDFISMPYEPKDV